MGYLLAIDPGESPGYALFFDGKLVELEDYEMRAAGLEFIVVELPEVYTGGKADANDLITLAYDAGRRVGNRTAQTVRPKTWKSQLPKEICRKRIGRLLDLSELSVWAEAEARYGRKFHNLADAVGIGLWYLGRRIV